MTRHAIDPSEVLDDPKDAATEAREDAEMRALIQVALTNAKSPGLAVRALAMAACGLASVADDPQAALFAVAELTGAWLDETRPAGDPDWQARVRARIRRTQGGG